MTGAALDAAAPLEHSGSGCALSRWRGGPTFWHAMSKATRAVKVEQGGQGAGTVLRFDMCVMGATRHLHQAVSTPEPGRVLVESDVEGPNRTTFTLTPVEDGARTRVEIASDLETSPGLFGAIEAAMRRWLIPPIYREELGNLARLAAERGA